MRCVGVFVGESLVRITQIATHCGLTGVQLHGDEAPELSRALLEKGYKVIRAFRVQDARSLAKIKKHPASVYLLDTFVNGQAGGTGKTFDWSLAAGLSGDTPIMLAGGLRPDNVSKAIRVARPWGVDVSSGVERQPGIKDHEKIKNFIKALRRS